jgi:hypothetical protein
MMVNQSMYSEGVEDALTMAQTELLEALLQAEESVYPWNPAEVAAEAYFLEQEQSFLLEDWSEEEITERSQQLFGQLDACWTTLAVTPEALKASLFAKFATSVPQGWLEAIAHRAHQLAASPLSLADQLVDCVQQLLPNWAEEDLLVISRPFAYAMRGTTDSVVDSTLNTIQQRAWTELSAMEQVRLSMAIARYAIAQLEQS